MTDSSVFDRAFRIISGITIVFAAVFTMAILQVTNPGAQFNQYRHMVDQCIQTEGFTEDQCIDIVTSILNRGRNR